MAHIPTEQERLIEECGATLCGRPLCHRLLADGQGYSIEVRFGEERATVPAGADLLFAATAYTAIARGAVTPCTLADVMADLTKEWQGD